MRILALFAVIVLAFASMGGADGTTGATVVYLVRHAETDPQAGSNPELTEVGVERAARLSDVLGDEPLTAIYCTATIRSHATARPTAERLGIDVQDYQPTDGAALRQRVLTDHRGERMLVVAHSNTVNVLLRALGGPEIGELAHDEFDRLIAVVIASDGSAQTIQLRY